MNQESIKAPMDLSNDLVTFRSLICIHGERTINSNLKPARFVVDTAISLSTSQWY